MTSDALVPFFTLLRKEILRFHRVWGQTLVVPLVNSSLYFLIFGLNLGHRIDLGTGHSYLSFLIPGLAMMGLLNNSFQNSSSSISTSKFHGDIEDLIRVPLSKHALVWAYGFGGLVRGLCVGLITLTVGECFHLFSNHTLLGIHSPLLLLLTACLGGLSFSFLGITLAFYAKSIDQLGAFGGFVLLPLMYLGGVFFRTDALPPIWQLIARGNPMLYFMDCTRAAFIGSSEFAPALSILVCLSSTVVLALVAYRTVQRGSFHRW